VLVFFGSLPGGWSPSVFAVDIAVPRPHVCMYVHVDSSLSLSPRFEHRQLYSYALLALLSAVIVGMI
jgi:hypothetical protein